MTIKKVETKEEKNKITINIMGALEPWFEPDSIETKAKIHEKLLFWSATDDDVIGFLAAKRHNQYTLEIYNFGVLPEMHRKGIGHNLLKEVAIYAQQNGYQFLTVKTLDVSADYEPYERTRAFYYKEGFLPLEVMETYWNRENPCLYLIKLLN